MHHVLQFSWCAWRDPSKAMVIRTPILISSLHMTTGNKTPTTIGTKLLGLAHGKAVRQWFCKWHSILMWGAWTLVTINWFIDWVLQRHATAQGAIDLCSAAWCFCLLSTALLSSNMLVPKSVLSKISGLYFLFCCAVAWGTMLVWRGQKESWSWWLKIFGIMLLTSTIVFIDALPQVKGGAFWRLVGLLTIAFSAAATYLHMKINTARNYSTYNVPELKIGHFIALSSYKKCRSQRDIHLCQLNNIAAICQLLLMTQLTQ
jgi:hypothetical protein